MKKIMAIALGLGLVLGSVSFAQDKKMETKTTKKAKTTKAKSTKAKATKKM